MANRLLIGLALLSLLGGCGEREEGPVRVSAIGDEPRLVNPNLERLDTPSALLLLATAQGLVNFDAAGQIEPALAQSWIVSDDGLRYTFRLRRAAWSNGERVTAAQVAERLRAASSTASSNTLKPLLGAVDEIVAMTDDVLEISLLSPRPNFLQLLAQPELAILRGGVGTGPYLFEAAEDGGILLSLPAGEDEEESPPEETSILLRGESAALAVTRFRQGEADMVTGGGIGDLAIARMARPRRGELRFDPVRGLFGLSFGTNDGLVGDAGVRRALAMSIDRDGLVAALGVPGLQPHDTLVPIGVTEMPAPVLPRWATTPIARRRTQAAAAIRTAAPGGSVILRVAVPDGPGYRLVFAWLKRDWSLIGVSVERVAAGARADLRLIDRVAAVDLGTWYLRQFNCDASAICSPEADARLAEARAAPTAAERQARLAEADRLLTDAVAFVPLAQPVRWSLVSDRLTGFAPNVFARHNLAELIAPVP